MTDYGIPEAVVKSPSLLGEGPVWDHDRQILYWLDCFSNRINIHSPSKGCNAALILPEVIGSMAVMADDGGDCTLILALQSGLYLLPLSQGFPDSCSEQQISAEELQFLTDPESDLPGNRFNDGKCDPAGRFWTGTMSRALDSGAGDLTPRGSLYCLDSSGRAERKVENVIISNGLAWSPDGKTLYYNDTPTLKVSAFDYDQDSGDIRNRRTVFHIPEGWGNPDGMTIDSEGMLWIALWEGFRIIRVNPHTGEALGFIRLPVRNVTSCCFGGRNLDELFITTSRSGLEGDTLTDPDVAGSLFRISLPVQGMPMNKVGHFSTL